MSATHVAIKLVPGFVAPQHAGETELACHEVVITEQGTASKLPIVDLVCLDQAGNTYVVTFTGRILNTISAAIKGVNQRNHGNPEP